MTSSRPAALTGALPRWARWLAAGIPLAFLAVLFAYPVATIVGMGLRGGGGLDTRPFAEVLGAPGLRRVAWFTLWQALASTGVTLLLGLPGAYVLYRQRWRGQALVRALVTVPFVLPTVVVGTAFVALLGARGPLHGLLEDLGVAGGRLTGTIWAILLAHAFFNYAVVVRTVGTLWAHLDPAIEDAARTLGAGPWRVFQQVTWPLLRPAIAAAAAITFLFTFTSFGVVLILGGPRLATLEVEIYRATAQLLDLRTAAVLALLQLAFVLVALGVDARLRGRLAGHGLARVEAAARPVGPRPRARLLTAANLAVMLLLLGAPIAILVERSLATDAGYSLAWYRALGGEVGRRSVLFVPPLEAIGTSLRYAVQATVVALVVGGAASVAVTSPGRGRRLLDTALMLPLGTSAVTVGFGFLVALDAPPLDLRGSAWLVPLAQALVATPFVVRILVPVIRAIDPRLREAAAVLGASPGRVFREVDLPMLGRGLGVAAGFAFVVSLGEFGATVFLATNRQPTVPVAIFRLLGQPGAANLGRAMAMATILMVLTAMSVLVIERLRPRGISGL